MIEKFFSWRNRLIRGNAFLRWLFVTKNDRITIFEWPNAPLIIWFVAMVIATITSGTFARISNDVSRLALFVWAVMEIGWGDSRFRRILGAIIAAMIVYSLFRH